MPPGSAPSGYQTPQQYNPQSSYDAQHGAPQPSGDPQQPYGAPQQPQYGAAAGPPKGNGLAIASIILAFIAPLIGLILGIVAVFKSRSKGLAITGIVLSLITSVVYTVVLLAVLDTAAKDLAAATTTTAASTSPSPSATDTTPTGPDAACSTSIDILVSSASDMQSDQNDPKKIATDLTKAIDGLKAQKGKATDPAVASALTAIIKDYTELRTDLQKLKQPSSTLLSNLTKDGSALDAACS